MAGQNKPFLRRHFGLCEVVTRIFWCEYTQYFIYNPLSINIHTHTHTRQMKLCVIVVIPPGGEAVGRPGSDSPTPSLHTNSSAAVDSRWGWGGGRHSATGGQRHFPTDQTPPPPPNPPKGRRWKQTNKKEEKVSCSSTATQKGNPSPQCKWAPVSLWNGLLSSTSEVSQVYSGIALWVTAPSPRREKHPRRLGNSGVQSVPLCFQRKKMTQSC